MLTPFCWLAVADLCKLMLPLLLLLLTLMASYSNRSACKEQGQLAGRKQTYLQWWSNRNSKQRRRFDSKETVWLKRVEKRVSLSLRFCLTSTHFIASSLVLVSNIFFPLYAFRRLTVTFVFDNSLSFTGTIPTIWNLIRSRTKLCRFSLSLYFSCSRIQSNYCKNIVRSKYVLMTREDAAY